MRLALVTGMISAFTPSSSRDEIGHVDVIALRLQVEARPSRTARNPAAPPP